MTWSQLDGSWFSLVQLVPKSQAKCVSKDRAKLVRIEEAEQGWEGITVVPWKGMEWEGRSENR